MAEIKYIYNDPTTPDLIGPYKLPEVPNVMPFEIEGYQGAVGEIGSIEHQAACCYVSLINSINLANHYLQSPLNHWAATNSLLVQPRAGKQLNAYYDRRALRFFYAEDPIKKAIIYTVNSTDIFCHEAGHAILDALRPDLFSMQAMEIWAFHEAFGDIHTMINMLQHDMILNYVLKETGNDLRKSNCVSKLAEEMGTTVYNMTGGRMGNTVGVLRDAVNSFKYVKPETLPDNGMDTQLIAEPHSFSRVFTGAWYDILVGIYEFLKTNLAPKEALIAARDVLASYTYNSLRVIAASVRFYNAAARAMLAIDKVKNSTYNSIMHDVFISRNILQQRVQPMPPGMAASDWGNFKITIKPSDEVIESVLAIMVRNEKKHFLALPFHMMTVEAPGDSYYEFDDAGRLIDMITTSPEELIKHAHECVDFLKRNNFIRPDRATPFQIDENGYLVRNHFVCFSDNCRNPQAPEYGKCWKPENNAGCGCAGKGREMTTCTTTPTTTTVVQKNLRQK